MTGKTGKQGSRKPHVGLWFHIHSADGCIEYQGQIIRVSNRRAYAYEIQYYSYLTGQPNGTKHVASAEMTGWSFYDTDSEMRAAYDAEKGCGHD